MTSTTVLKSISFADVCIVGKMNFQSNVSTQGAIKYEVKVLSWFVRRLPYMYANELQVQLSKHT